MSKKAFKKQCAVLAYRLSKRGPKIALVTSLETRRWVLPKGNLVNGLSARESAALEAFEEAGLEGTMAKRSCGSYDYEKTELKGGALCRVSVYPMAVTRVKRNWPEKALRQRKWMSIEKAVAAVGEAELKTLIARFGKTLK
ncbi:NUDIX hydrolase [Pelagibius sp.]|uniref:NUDIX hydrolase n=1 Tax=Pelagibius sp. TaxID=1931238 RepID=UPI0026056F15|nr:NUDIX hydrolase [Pelagibius sp.]